MFNFLGKFKQQVVEGFNSVHQRLVTLEAKVEALFEHTKVQAAEAVKQDAAKVEAPVAAEVTAVEAEVKGAEDAKQDS